MNYGQNSVVKPEVIMLQINVNMPLKMIPLRLNDMRPTIN
jgi:hypothetical protein